MSKEQMYKNLNIVFKIGFNNYLSIGASSDVLHNDIKNIFMELKQINWEYASFALNPNIYTSEFYNVKHGYIISPYYDFDYIELLFTELKNSKDYIDFIELNISEYVEVNNKTVKL